AFLPGELTTVILRAEADFTSTFTGPPRQQASSFRASAAASTSAVTGAPCTARMSASPRCSATWTGEPRYSRIESSDSVAGTNFRDSSSWTYSTDWARSSPSKPALKTSTGTNESPITTIFIRPDRLRVDPAWLQIDRMPGARLHDHLEHRLGVQVVEADRLADPAFHHDLRA